MKKLNQLFNSATEQYKNNRQQIQNQPNLNLNSKSYLENDQTFSENNQHFIKYLEFMRQLIKVKQMDIDIPIKNKILESLNNQIQLYIKQIAIQKEQTNEHDLTFISKLSHRSINTLVSFREIKDQEKLQKSILDSQQHYQNLKEDYYNYEQIFVREKEKKNKLQQQEDDLQLEIDHVQCRLQDQQKRRMKLDHLIELMKQELTFLTKQDPKNKQNVIIQYNKYRQDLKLKQKKYEQKIN